jgi:Asp-tRNA(Asn)/Glu-tRNA(Gln) amidotransferase A subunit family amidase
LRILHRALRGKVDGFITLAHIGPGQKGMPAVGTPWYNDPSSAIGAPTLGLPLLEIEGVPLGVQLMGFEHEDYSLVAMARWLTA